jgi:U3 small nucleolar RNA-associated protein 3
MISYGYKMFKRLVCSLLLQMRSGDADVLPQKPLHERRAAFDAVAARRAAAAGDSDDEAGLGGSGKQRKRKQGAADYGGEEDELYAATKAAKAALKAEKRRKQDVQQQFAPPLPEEDAVGQRKISYEIEKNRGLTPHRCAV